MRIKKIFVLLMVGLTGGAPTWAQTQKKVEALLADISQKKWSSCVTKADELLTLDLLLKDFAETYKLHCLVQQERWADAAVSLKSLRDRAMNYQLEKLVLKSDLAWQISQGSEKNVYQAFSQLQKKMRRDPEWPDYLFRRAEYSARQKNQTQACRDIETLFVEHPEHASLNGFHAFLPRNRIGEMNMNCVLTYSENRERIKNLYWTRGPKIAQQNVEQLAPFLNPYDADRLQAYLWTLTGDLEDSLKLLQKHYQTKKDDPDFLSAMAQVAARLGRGALAIALYEQVAAFEKRPTQKQQAEYFVGFTSYQFRDYDGAQRRLEQFIKKYPRARQGAEARWLLAWISYLKGRYEDSANRLEALSSSSRDKAASDRATYWRARSLQNLNRHSEAYEILKELSQDTSLGYYSLVAKARLEEYKEVPLPQQMVFMARWVKKGWQNQPFLNDGVFPEDFSIETQFTNPLSQGLENESFEEPSSIAGSPSQDSEATSVETPLPLPQLEEREKLARLYQTLGLYDLAKWEFVYLERKSPPGPFLESLLADYKSIGQYNRASVLAQLRLGEKRRSLGIERGRNLWAAAYPQAFSDYVKSSGKEFQVNESFVWSIMRAESLYRQEAISPVGALGLMQVMPETGRNIASIFGEEDFEPRSLLQPEQAVRYGTRYLARLLQSLNNSMPVAAAAYNAGPHRAHLWLSLYGDLDGDEFIEHIPFTETRNYVKKVMANYYIYSKLYEDPKLNMVQFREPFDVQVVGPAPTKESWNDI